MRYLKHSKYIYLPNGDSPIVAKIIGIEYTADGVAVCASIANDKEFLGYIPWPNYEMIVISEVEYIIGTILDS